MLKRKNKKSKNTSARYIFRNKKEEQLFKELLTLGWATYNGSIKYSVFKDDDEYRYVVGQRDALAEVKVVLDNAELIELKTQELINLSKIKNDTPNLNILDAFLDAYIEYNRNCMKELMESARNTELPTEYSYLVGFNNSLIEIKNALYMQSVLTQTINHYKSMLENFQRM